MCHQLGAMACAVSVTIDRDIGLDDAHYLGHDVARAPRRAAKVYVGVVAGKLAGRAGLV